MNRLRLSGNSQTINLTFGDTEIIGTSAIENIILDMSLNNISLGISADDSVTFGKEISEYDITTTGGNQVDVTDNDGNSVTVSVNGTGEIGFLNGKASLDMNVSTMKPSIGGVDLSSTPLDTGSVTLDELPLEIINGGLAAPNFNNIINGGVASSIFN